jgi:hypothetical protein
MSQQQAADSSAAAKGEEDYEEEELVDGNSEEGANGGMNDESYEEILEESDNEEEVEDMGGSYEEMVLDDSAQVQTAVDEKALVPAPSTALVEVNNAEDPPAKVTESFVQQTPMMPEDVPEDEAKADMPDEEATTGDSIPTSSAVIAPLPEQAPPINDKRAQQSGDSQNEEEEKGKSGFLWLIAFCCLFLVIGIGIVLILIFATETIPRFWEDDDDGPVTMGPYDPGNCDLASQGPQPSVAGQCECGDQVEILSDYTRDRYNELLDFIQPDIFTTWPYDITSCDPANLALLWLSTGPVIGDELSLKQRYILAYLYYGTQGQEWTESSDWLSVQDECGWFGLECSGEELTKIELPGNSLDGQVRLCFLYCRVK